MTERLDPGAYIGSEPELEEETIQGGVQPGDERVAAYGSAPGAEGEPDRMDLDVGDARLASDVADQIADAPPVAELVERLKAEFADATSDFFNRARA